MPVSHSPDSGLPEATLFIGGPGLNPEAVTHALGKTPYKSSRGPRPRWFWTSAGRIDSLDADDHLRAVLDLAEAFERKRRAFPNVELHSSLFLPDGTPRPGYSEQLVLRLRRFGPVTLNLSSAEEATVLLPRRHVRPKAAAVAARAGSRSRA
jgi:hypothetical protein